jgi:adenine phosphoribosyltransferase
MSNQSAHLQKYIREIPDWPVKGVLFRDITPLLADAAAFKAAVEAMVAPFTGRQIEYVGAVDARGFIFGAAIAQKLGVGLVPVRKKGKLPFKTKGITYDLEYGTASLEIHTDAFPKGAKVLLVDDLLATGGTVAAAATLIEKVGGEIVGLTFLVELGFLHGRDKLLSYDVKTVITY